MPVLVWCTPEALALTTSVSSYSSFFESLLISPPYWFNRQLQSNPILCCYLGELFLQGLPLTPPPNPGTRWIILMQPFLVTNLISSSPGVCPHSGRHSSCEHVELQPPWQSNLHICSPPMWLGSGHVTVFMLSWFTFQSNEFGYIVYIIQIWFYSIQPPSKVVDHFFSSHIQWPTGSGRFSQVCFPTHFLPPIPRYTNLVTIVASCHLPFPLCCHIEERFCDSFYSLSVLPDCSLISIPFPSPWCFAAIVWQESRPKLLTHVFFCFLLRVLLSSHFPFVHLAANQLTFPTQFFLTLFPPHENLFIHPCLIPSTPSLSSPSPPHPLFFTLFLCFISFFSQVMFFTPFTARKTTPPSTAFVMLLRFFPNL